MHPGPGGEVDPKKTSDHRLPLPARPLDRIARPVRRFLAVESAGGAVLFAATVVALVAANVPGVAEPFHHFWETPVVLGVGPFVLRESLHFWVNDALMALFFFVVGLEIKRELVDGELSTPKKAALPVIAAAGGMVFPAGVYLAFQWGQPGERGWGVPMATDIAFVVGVLAALGKRAPFGLKVFLLSLAIADDIGAILVIAAAYSGSPDWVALAAAAGGFAVTYGLNRLGVRTVAVYVLVGAGVWLATLKSGIHPTIAGVMLGLLTPASAWVGQGGLRDALSTLLGRVTEGSADADDLGRVSFAAKEAVSPLERLVTLLHPWVAFAIMPVFALANAGVAVRPGALGDPVAVAVAVGLVLGKPVGIFGLSFLAVKLGVAQLPRGVTWRHVVAAGCLGGIGFTMSLFVAGLAFHEGAQLDAAKVGILVGSTASALLGGGLLLLGPTKKEKQD